MRPSATRLSFARTRATAACPSGSVRRSASKGSPCRSRATRTSRSSRRCSSMSAAVVTNAGTILLDAIVNDRPTVCVLWDEGARAGRGTRRQEPRRRPLPASRRLGRVPARGRLRRARGRDRRGACGALRRSEQSASGSQPSSSARSTAGRPSGSSRPSPPRCRTHDEARPLQPARLLSRALARALARSSGATRRRPSCSPQRRRPTCQPSIRRMAPR